MVRLAIAWRYIVEHRSAHNLLVRLNSTSRHSYHQVLLQSIDPINETTAYVRVTAILTQAVDTCSSILYLHCAFAVGGLPFQGYDHKSGSDKT